MRRILPLLIVLFEFLCAPCAFAQLTGTTHAVVNTPPIQVQMQILNGSTYYAVHFLGATTAAKVQDAINAAPPPAVIVIGPEMAGTSGDFSSLVLTSNQIIVRDERQGAVVYGVQGAGNTVVAAGGGSGGARSDLSNLASPTKINITALTGAGAIGLMAGGTNQNVTVASSGTGYLLLNPSGSNVGIGTVNPNLPLDVRLSGLQTGSVVSVGNDMGGLYGLIGIRTSDGAFTLTGSTNDPVSIGSNNNLDRLYITNAGNVGIGTVNPNLQLQIAKAMGSGLNTVTFSSTPAFDASLGNTQQITLTGNVTSSTLSNAVAGEKLNFVICQDATGSHTLVWPTNTINAPTINSAASSCTYASSTFDGTNLQFPSSYALQGGGTITGNAGAVNVTANGTSAITLTPGTGATTITKSLNNTAYANAFVGADAGAQYTACLGALPATGGTCDGSGIQGAVSASAQVTVGAKQILRLGAATITVSGTNGFLIDGSGAVLEGSSNYGTIIKAAAGFTGCLVKMDSPSATVSSISDVSVHDILFDVSAAPTAHTLCLNSVRDPSNFYNLETDGSTGTSVIVDTSSVPTSPAISEGLHFYDFYDNGATPKVADRWIIRGDDIVIGPNVTLTGPAGDLNFNGLTISSHASSGTQAVGVDIRVARSAFAEFGTGINLTGTAGNAPTSVSIINDNFEGNALGWDISGPDAADLSKFNTVAFNNYLSNTKMGKLDYAEETQVLVAATTGGTGTITLTANSKINTVNVLYSSALTDVSDLGTGNCISGPFQPGVGASNQNFSCAVDAPSVIGLTGALTPNAAGGTDVGSASLPFANFWLGGAATNNAKLTGTFTAARVFTLPDTASDTFTMNAATQTLTNKTLTSPTISTTISGSPTFPAPGAIGGTTPAAGTFTALGANTQLNVNGTLVDSATAPTLTGFGTSPSIVASSGTAAFEINVGTGGTASSGTITFPAAAHGWAVHCDDVTTQSTSVAQTQQTAFTTTTAVITQYSDVHAATAWAASDILVCQARAF